MGELVSEVGETRGNNEEVWGKGRERSGEKDEGNGGVRGEGERQMRGARR